MFKSIIRCRAHGYNEITTVKVERDTKKEPFMLLQKILLLCIAIDIVSMLL
jgi:hypothetical protein